MKSRKRRIVTYALVILLVGVVVTVVVPFFLPWVPLNCTHQDVDITTGRVRYSRYVLFCRVSKRIEDSPLTEVLPSEFLRKARSDWHRVNTLSPGVHYSPHYRFHGAVHQIYDLARAWKTFDLAPTVRQKSAMHLLALWQHDGSDFLAGVYLSGLYDLGEPEKREHMLVSLSDLEMPKVDTNGTQLTHTVFHPNGQPMDRFQAYMDKDGRLVKHGVREMWYPDGKRQLYDHFDDGDVDGRRFAWNRDGVLTEIAGFDKGELTEYESKNLTNHPDYGIAQQLAGGDSDNGGTVSGRPQP